jgi:hypothetical protein
LSPKTLTILGVGFLGIISLGYLYTQFRSLNAAPQLIIVSPGQDGTVDSGLLRVEGKTEPGSKLFINNQPAVVDSDGNFAQNLSLALGSNQIVFRSRNRFEEETSVARTIVYQEKAIAGSFDDATREENAEDAGTEEKFAFQIQVEDEAAWVEIVVDQEIFFSGTMLPGSKRQVAEADTISVSSGNAGATRVIINGEDMGVLGGKGEVVKNKEF